MNRIVEALRDFQIRLRARHGRWIQRLEDETGWFVDPTGRHRIRYMHRAKWTKWVADGDAAFLD